VKLDAQLIDVTGNLGPLRFVFFQLMLKIGDFRGINGLRSRMRNDGRLAAALALQGRSRRGRVHYERSSAMGACENNILSRRRVFWRGIARLHRALFQQETYRMREPRPFRRRDFVGMRAFNRQRGTFKRGKVLD